ncbi:hypothetical protein A8F94_18935 [Bacillus sp. FJAT-27225]|uniref:DUF7662 domain-containing protein n=1 Tax=Bacillus sp. FJAT-27225 TaxID=1743144 RepID=UPI00080C31FA|nr:hypothetical protein [Bacillus sp. FJAT-27225]OCA83192.1 hypothetical protein A8F94_18935 [Bacillus sp. FJAT-27225]
MYNGKYYNLHEYLAKKKNEVSRLTLTLSEMEEIVGFKLPQSAYVYPAWWANENKGSHTHARSWLLAGWKTAEVKPGNQVTFFYYGN